MASARCILLNFDNYQKAKINFLQGISDFTLKKEVNMEQLLDLNIMQQMSHLLADDAPNVQNLALVTTVRLCAASEVIAQRVLERKILSCLGCTFETQTREYRRNILQIAKNISKYPALTTELLMQTKEMLTTTIHNIDTVQRELVLSTLASIANYSPCNAIHVMDLKVLPQVIVCLQFPINLALEATQLIKALSKHTGDITRPLVDNDVIRILSDNLHNNDTKLIKQTLLCMAEIAKHCVDYAEIMINSKALCKAILLTSHCDNIIKRSAAVLLRELSKYHADLSRKIVQHGALAGLINIVVSMSAMVRLPAVMALGYMAAQHQLLALAIIHSKGLEEIIKALNNESNQACLSALVWTLEQITKHSAQHVNYLNDTNIFAKLLRIYISADSSKDMKSRCLSALNNTVDKCLNVQDIDLLLYESPPEILLPAVRQLCKIFVHDLKARRVFVCTGGLKRVQALQPEPGSELCEAVTIINSYFPEDIVRYYAPRCAASFIKQAAGNYSPEVSADEIDCSTDSSIITCDDSFTPSKMIVESVPEELNTNNEQHTATPLPYYDSATNMFFY